MTNSKLNVDRLCHAERREICDFSMSDMGLVGLLSGVIGLVSTEIEMLENNIDDTLIKDKGTF